MTEPRQLRPYQLEAVEAVESYWTDSADRENQRNTPVVVLPTGTGKSTVIASLAVRVRALGGRVAMLAHRRELLDQMAASVAMVDPDGERVGIVQADRDDPSTAIVAASFQTLQNQARLDSLGRRDVILVDECFVAGTPVDGVPIEKVQAGDWVTAMDTEGNTTRRKVLHVMRSVPTSLVQVTTSAGETFTCTPGHPFLTPDGWVPAGRLSNGVRLHHAPATTEPTPMHSVWESCRHAQENQTGPVEQITTCVLQHHVSGPVCPGVSCQDHGRNQSPICLTENDRQQPHAPSRGTRQGLRRPQRAGKSTPYPGREWHRNHGTTTCPSDLVGVADGGACVSPGRGASVPLLPGYSPPHGEAVRGSGRVQSPVTGPTTVGQTPGHTSTEVWVDHVTVLQPGSDGRYGGVCPDGYVYNLEVDTDHTYTVGSGITVHNCHHSTAETYQAVLERLGVTNGSALACGFTATMARSDGGLGKVWDAVVYERSLKWAIQSGFLITPRGLTVVLPDLHLDKVHVRGGDYAAVELADAMEASVETTVDAVLHHAPDRVMIVFAAGVEHAEALAAALTARGILSAAVTGSMSGEEREVVYSAYREGRVQAMVTVQVLTEGADFPRCDCVVMARPTRSQTLYSQMVGRAVRLYDGKEDALVLDLAGTVRDMSLVTITDLSPEAETRRVSPASDEDPGQDEPKPPRPQRIGPVVLEDVDLLATSHAVWLRTPGGVLFLDIGQAGYVFLWPPEPTDGMYAVGLIHRPQRYGDGWVAGEEPSLDLQDAKELAEDTAERHGTLPSRTASWRKKGPPSAAQLNTARVLHIPDVMNKNRARLSDDISTAKAAKVLDIT